MGVTYFFGGLWKLIDGRLSWIFGESLRYHVYTRWYAMGKIPRFAHFLINEPSWFFHVGALVVIAFELSFIVLVLFPRSRTFVAAAGLLFHNTLGLLMANIFFHLQVCYVSFLDWHRIFRWFGQRCFERPEYILFDGGCKRCRRTVSALRVLDVLQPIIYVDAACRESQSKLSQSHRPVLLHRVHALSDGRKSEFFPCYSVATRIPLLWLVYPFLFLSSKPVFARRMLPAATRSKKYEILSSELLRTGNGDNVFGRGLTLSPLICIGVTLIAVNTAFGLFKLHGWPFTCGPTFSHIATPKIRSFAVTRVNPSGKVAVFKRSGIFKWLSGERLGSVYDNIYRHPEKPELPTAFCGFLRKTVPGWADATLIQFYVEHVSVVPTEQSKNPLDRTLFFECKR
jgi:predicted DCC family thiol-disulfide oxidoreductase YuxK